MNYKISYVLTRQICPRSLSYNSPKTSRRIDKEKNLTKNSFPAYGSNPLHDCQILVKQSSLIEKEKEKKKKVGTVPNEKTMEKTRFAEYSQRHDIHDISYNGKKSGLMSSPPHSRFIVALY